MPPPPRREHGVTSANGRSSSIIPFSRQPAGRRTAMSFGTAVLTDGVSRRPGRTSGRVVVGRGEGGLVLGLQLLAGRVVPRQRLARVNLGADERLELLLLPP